MERELFRAVYQRAYQLGRSRHTKHVVFPDWKIVVMYFWAVLHDRPTCWACDVHNWPNTAQKILRLLPSASTMSRRLRRPEVLTLIDALEHAIKPAPITAKPIKTKRMMFIDAKPLPVGWYTKDNEALRGWASSGVGKGYKLHAICNEQMMPLAWVVRPMNERESLVARQLIPQLHGSGIIVGDTAYDSNPLYELAGQHDFQLVAPRRAGKGFGKRRQSRRRLFVHQIMSQAQRDAILNKRSCIERWFGRLGNNGFGLKPLPSWVRRFHRVKLWVQAKIILYIISRRLTDLKTVP